LKAQESGKLNLDDPVEKYLPFKVSIFNTNMSDKAGNKAFFDIWNAMEKYQNRFQK